MKSYLGGTNLTNIEGVTYSHLNVNPVPPPKLTKGILIEKGSVCQNPHHTFSFHC